MYSKILRTLTLASAFLGLSAFTCNPSYDTIIFRVPTYHPPAQCAQSMDASHARLTYYEPGWRAASQATAVSFTTSEIVPALSYSTADMGNYWLAVVNDAYYDAQGCSPTSEPTHCVKRANDASWIHILIRQSYWDACPSPFSIKSLGAQAVGRAYGLGWSKTNATSVMHRPPNTDTPSNADQFALQDCTGLGYSEDGISTCTSP